MTEIVRHKLWVTTDANGNAVVYTPVVFGRVLQVRYVPDNISPLETGADLDITLKESGVVVANHDTLGSAAFTKVYRQSAHTHNGETHGVYEPVFVAGEPIKLVIANGGNAKSGTFYIWTG